MGLCVVARSAIVTAPSGLGRDAMRQWNAALRAAILIAACSFSAVALGQSKLAPGFAKLPAGATILVMPIDIELFELGVGGLPAPRADWTQEARERIRQSYVTRKQWRVQAADLQDDPQVVELNRLHDAVGAAILVHHFGEKQRLKGKYGKLDWTLGRMRCCCARRPVLTTPCSRSC